jgi:hypothetical protein
MSTCEARGSDSAQDVDPSLTSPPAARSAIAIKATRPSQVVTRDRHAARRSGVLRPSAQMPIEASATTRPTMFPNTSGSTPPSHPQRVRSRIESPSEEPFGQPGHHPTVDGRDGYEECNHKREGRQEGEVHLAGRADDPCTAHHSEEQRHDRDPPLHALTPAPSQQVSALRSSTVARSIAGS